MTSSERRRRSRVSALRRRELVELRRAAARRPLPGAAEERQGAGSEATDD